jgi:hypothetical protein
MYFYIYLATGYPVQPISGVSVDGKLYFLICFLFIAYLTTLSVAHIQHGMTAYVRSSFGRI